MTGESKFVPNSFQTPNAYVDEIMHLLTNAEFRCLIYATRRILGFQKRQDRIALSQFTNGTRRDDGSFLDHGTGLSRGTVVETLESLTKESGLLIKLSENNPRVNEGAEYALQLDSSKINFQFLLDRFENWAKIRAGQTEKARKAKDEKERSVQQTREGVCSTDQPHTVQQTGPSLFNRPGLVCSTDSQKTVLNTDLKPEETQMGAPSAPAPLIKNQGAFAALQSFEKNHKRGEVDFSDFPENVREIIREFCRLWSLRPPAKTGRRGEFALWLNEAVELSDACGEFGFRAMEQAAQDYRDTDIDKRFTVARPGSVVRFVRATAGKMRESAGRADARARKVDSFETFREKQAYLFPGEPVTEQDYKHYLMSQGVRV